MARQIASYGRGCGRVAAWEKINVACHHGHRVLTMFEAILHSDPPQHGSSRTALFGAGLSLQLPSFLPYCAPSLSSMGLWSTFDFGQHGIDTAESTSFSPQLVAVRVLSIHRRLAVSCFRQHQTSFRSYMILTSN